MEAAIIACDRGHQVTLVDDHSSLGGTLYFTDVDVDKPDLRYERTGWYGRWTAGTSRCG